MIRYVCDAELRFVDTEELFDVCEMSIEVPMELDKKQQYACMILLNGLDSDDFTYWVIKNMREK